MAAPGKQSRWGSLLSQAVAGVESRLDNMLTESDHGPGQTQRPQSPSARAAQTKPSSANSRSSSTSRGGDRLQARLAKAVVGKTPAGGVDGKTLASPRSSTDQASRAPADGSPAERDGKPVDAVAPDSDDATSLPCTTRDSPALEPLEASAPPAQVLQEQEATAHQQVQQSVPPQDVEELKKLQQQEVQEYVERIDSLQSKLQYLSSNAAEAAKKTAASAPLGSTERKLAEKDEKIALLMHEGQKLSGTEQKLRLTIKRLRQQMTEHDKQSDQVRKSRDKATAEIESLRQRLDGAQGSDRQQEAARRSATALHKELDLLRREVGEKDRAHRQLEQEFRVKTEEVNAAGADALRKALAAEREKQKELEDSNAVLVAQTQSLMASARQENIEWQEKLQRSVERARNVEDELRLELQSMERKLESMRMAVEEASSGTGGEAQVKMFRQLETLQCQYASSRENWRGMESSLLGKAASLERERDEAHRRESEMRKKAREAATRSRLLEDELHDAKTGLASAREELESCRHQLSSLQTSSATMQETLEQTRAELDKQRQAAARTREPSTGDSSRDEVMEAERRKWVDDVAGATSKGHDSRPDSPMLSVTRTLSSDLASLAVPGRSRRVATPASIPDSQGDMMALSMRRLSSQAQMRIGGVSTAPAPFSPFDVPPESPLIPSPPTGDRDSAVDETAPSSPRNLTHDMISVSTVAAGPSVQLVERMSAAIRRLEADKVAAKEEMARVCNQRDEARSDMVGLMKHLEEAKTAAGRLPQLEAQVADLDARYQTTLEMLGEKSELVEELRADVDDVKAMYRELVERTVT
ncbi:hypothetical protein CDD82_6773 [Ophiocordyceps australis]|uniref:TATA element modulatory factor 1 TATA binding domain-containing protein n=1 Tax=Ophiocordyceps australis TaxID=1399860 RepID=A0A2C5XYT2_9HYPO|nr:hypothetical protein CDD82_6773 [Ophiocordyceps australis]